jgi:glycosyltransferase involved in cell wall biosynthesis
MHITYVGAGRFPTEKANGYQIAQMLQAFQLANAQHCLIHYDERPFDKRDVLPETIYGLRLPLHRATYDISPALLKALASRIIGPIASKLLLRIQAAKASRIILQDLGLVSDVIYTRHPQIAAYLLRSLPSQYTRCLCVEVHSLSERPATFKRDVAILSRVAKVVTITNAMRNRLISAGLVPDRILVAHDAVDDYLFTGPNDRRLSRRQLYLPITGKNICYVGRFQTLGQEKGIPEIIRASALLLQRHPDAYFTLVGGPTEAISTYQDLIAEMNLPSDKFIFPGHRPLHEIKTYLDAADVLLMPMPHTHHYAYNASPLKLFQYMTAGRAIVASDLPSIREVVGNEKAALLPTPGDPTALAAAVDRVLTDENLSSSLAASALELSRQYTWQARAESIIKFLGC